MPRTGRPRQDLRQSPLEHLEAFCCNQVVRIEERLHARYAIDARIRNGAGQMVSGNQYHVMPQNSHMTQLTINRDCVIEHRGLVSTGTPRRDNWR